MPTFAAPFIPLLRRLRARATDEAGLTLIEVVVTALIVCLISTGTAVALIGTAHATADQQLRSQASVIVSQDQERLRSLTAEQIAQLGGSGSTRTVLVNGTSFQVTSSAVFQDVQGNSGCSSTAVQYFKATSTVTWSESFHNGSAQTQTMSAQTLLGRPVIGDLATSVTDQTGAGVSGVTVTATPPSGTAGQSTETSSTDGTGCAVMTGLTAATYGLTIGKSGYVDKSDLSPTPQSASVTASGTPTTTSDIIGLAGTVGATFGTYNSAAGEANAISFTGAGNTLTSPATLTAPSSPATSASTTLNATSLFPFNESFGTGSPTYTNNWTVYAGSCSFQAPPPSSQTKYTVGPGATATAATSVPASAPSGATSVQEPLLKLSSVMYGTKTVQPTDIVLTYSNGTCQDQYKATVATPASGSGLGATPPTNGWLANPGQPFAPSGDLSICADYSATPTQTSGWISGTGSAVNTSMTSANPVNQITLSPGSRCAGAS